MERCELTVAFGSRERGGQERSTLRPSDRLKRRAEFERVQERGRKHHGRHVLVIVLPRGDDGPARLGITVTRKVGNAVERNRIKRLVRELFRRERDRFPRGADVVVVAKRGAASLDYESLARDLPRLVGASRREERREGPHR